MKLSRTNGRGLDLFQQLIRDQCRERIGLLLIEIVILRQAPAPLVACVAAVIYQTADKPGDSSGEATPVPIPNTAVKLSSAEDTERAAFRENRSSPGFLRSRGTSPWVPVGPPMRSRLSLRG